MNRIIAALLTLMGFRVCFKHVYTKNGSTIWHPDRLEDETGLTYKGKGIIAEKYEL